VTRSQTNGITRGVDRLQLTTRRIQRISKICERQAGHKQMPVEDEAAGQPNRQKETRRPVPPPVRINISAILIAKPAPQRQVTSVMISLMKKQDCRSIVEIRRSTLGHRSSGEEWGRQRPTARTAPEGPRIQTRRPRPSVHTGRYARVCAIGIVTNVYCPPSGRSVSSRWAVR